MTLSPTFETHTELAKRAAAMLPLLDRNQQHSDEAGELAPDVVDAFHRDGMFLMWVPRALGGSELGPLDSLEVLEITSYGDPSAGWVQMAACLSTGVAAAYLGPHAVDELFHDGQLPGHRRARARGRAPRGPSKAGTSCLGSGASDPGSSTARTSTRSGSSKRPASRASS